MGKRPGYEVLFGSLAESDLRTLRHNEQAHVLDEVEDQLRYQPTRKTKRKKELREMVFPPDFEPPVWQLRVGDLRVFYDVHEDERTVTVRRIRRKPPEKRTEDIVR